MSKAQLIDTIHTRSNKWTIYKVYTLMSFEFQVYKNDKYQYMAKDLRYIVDNIKKSG